jgi:hypothetical protein
MKTKHKSIVDCIILLSLMMIAMAIMWNPYYLKQELNLFEWGLYLPGIDAVSQGQVPYRDFFHLRGPFELYAPALFMKIFGHRADVLATYFYLGTILTIFVAILIAYELINQRFLLYSFVLVLVTRTFPRVVFTFWGGMRYAWGLLAIWCLIRFFKTRHPAWLFTSGCLAAIGAGTSIEIGVLAAIAFVSVVVINKEYHRSAWIFLSGFLIISLPYAIYLLSQQAFMQYVQAQWIVITQMQHIFLQTDPVPDTVSKFFHAIFFPLDKSFYQMTPMYCYMIFFSFYFWRVFNKKSTALDHAALAVAVYGLMLFLTGFRNLFASEYEMALQPEKIVLFFLLGQFFAWAGQRLTRFNWVVPVLLILVLMSSVLYSAGRIKTRFYKSSWAYQLISSRNEKTEELINGEPISPIDLPRISHMSIPTWQRQDLEELKSFVDEHVPVHETVWMYPELGSLNFMLDRPWVGRFPIATLSWLDESWFTEYETALERNPPQYAIVNKVMPSYFNTTYFLVPANRLKHERTMQFLHSHYVIETETSTYFIYRRIH